MGWSFVFLVKPNEMLFPIPLRFEDIIRRYAVIYNKYEQWVSIKKAYASYGLVGKPSFLFLRCKKKFIGFFFFFFFCSPQQNFQFSGAGAAWSCPV